MIVPAMPSHTKLKVEWVLEKIDTTGWVSCPRSGSGGRSKKTLPTAGIFKKENMCVDRVVGIFIILLHLGSQTLYCL